MKTDEPLAQTLNSSAGSYELVLSAALLGAIGWFVDRQLGSTPMFIIGLSALGFVGAVISLIYRYKADMADATSKRVGTRP